MYLQSCDSNLPSDKNSVGSSKSLSNFSNDVENDHNVIFDSEDNKNINNKDYKSDNSIIEDYQTMDSENANDDLCNAVNSCSGTKEIRNDADEQMEVDRSMERKVEDDEQMDDKEKDQIKYDQNDTVQKSLKYPRINLDKFETIIEVSDHKPSLCSSSKKKDKSLPDITLIPHRCTQNINKFKSFGDMEENKKEVITDGNVKNLLMKTPLVTKPIIVKDTKKFIYIPAGTEQKSDKKAFNFAIIDKTERYRVPVKSNTQNNIIDIPQALSKMVQNSYNSVQQPHPTNNCLISTPIPIPNPPIILTTLIDDTFIAEAPSFIVPFVRINPPIKQLKEFFEKKMATSGDAGSDDIIDLTIDSEEEETDSIKDKPKIQSSDYFKSPFGKFFMEIGANLVQEHVQLDLLRTQRRKRDCEGDKCTEDVHVAISSLIKTLDISKENNNPFQFGLKKCESCNFKSESTLVMSHHLETPHMTANSCYGCNFCTFQVCSTRKLLQHMDTHGIQGRLEKKLALHQCPSCPFETRKKSNLTSHLISCAKNYQPEINQAPPLDWEPPAKIPRVLGSNPSMKSDDTFDQAVFNNRKILQLKQPLYNNMVPVSGVRAHGRTVLLEQQLPGIVPTFPTTLPNQTSKEISLKNTSIIPINQPMTVRPLYSMNRHTYQALSSIIPRGLQSKYSMRPGNAVNQATMSGFKQVTTPKMLQKKKYIYNKNNKMVSAFGVGDRVRIILPKQQFPETKLTFPTTLPNQTSKEISLENISFKPINQPMTVPPLHSINGHTYQASPSIKPIELQSKHSMRPGNTVNQTIMSGFKQVTTPNMLQLRQEKLNKIVSEFFVGARDHTVLPGQQFPGMVPTFPTTPPNQTSQGISSQNMSIKPSNQPITVPPLYSINEQNNNTRITE